MKYITSVASEDGMKHIIDCGSGNVEVIRMKETERYGNKQGQQYFQVDLIKVFDDLTFSYENHSSLHLAKVVLVIEKVRFVMQHLKMEIRA